MAAETIDGPSVKAFVIAATRLAGVQFMAAGRGGTGG